MENEERKDLRELIREGLVKTYERLVEYKRYKNSPLIISKDGKIIELDPWEADKHPPHKI